MARARGIVLRLVRAKGFGFVKDKTSGTERFFHRTAVVDRVSFERLSEGDAVTYEINEGPKGPRAHDIDLDVGDG